MLIWWHETIMANIAAHTVRHIPAPLVWSRTKLVLSWVLGEQRLCVRLRGSIQKPFECITRSRGLRVLLSIGTVSSIFCVMERINPPTKIGAEISLIEGTHAQMHKSKSRTVRAESSHAHHPFFGNSLHRRTSLERRINTVWLSVNSPRSSGRTLPLGVKILDERVVTVQGNIKPPNLLIDPQTLQATIIDFGGVSALPHSFVSFTLAHCRVFGVRPITLW
ncbi:uncharacterized protein EI90DRAFT_3017871 [Cantharellus anzutake]|uniref:uncharacterized protein n=1 Tax=Cantharellus anzutake TaxID=1750568 RepID=UPI0019046A2F|nr:uncharacterized protein EI90DRAFT_3017871 [Cantharellus anzutake]KAF8328253.1 hypothetical protein EI90DRAFT_3017871 [Cantharellus anzutake]